MNKNNNVENLTNEDMPRLINEMSDEQLVMLVLTKACTICETNEIDILEFINICMLVIRSIEDCYGISSTRLFFCLEKLIAILEEVAEGDGIIEIYKINSGKRELN